MPPSPRTWTSICVDSDATRKTALIHRWLAKRPRYHLHFTPKGASWINRVERRFALLTEKLLRRGVHRKHPRSRGGHRSRLDRLQRSAEVRLWTKTADKSSPVSPALVIGSRTQDTSADHSFVARIATAATSSPAFTGLARQNWNPARSTFARSWAAAKPVTNAAGVVAPVFR